MASFKDKEADMKLVYKKADGLDLPLWVFLPDTDIHNARTVLLIHGGGWNDAIKDNSEWNGGWMCNNARYLCENGFIAIVISYRSLMVSEELNVGNLLEDCQDAVAYIKEHLKFVSFDDTVYMGDSAGGYLVTMLGLGEDCPPAVVSLNPVLGLLDTKWKYGFNNCDIKSLTPVHNVGGKCSDFLFMHGTGDTVVEIEYTRELNDLLRDKGYKSELIEIPEAQHAFVLYNYKYPDDYVTKIMDNIIDYIKKNF